MVQTCPERIGGGSHKRFYKKLIFDTACSGDRDHMSGHVLGDRIFKDNNHVLSVSTVAGELSLLSNEIGFILYR